MRVDNVSRVNRLNRTCSFNQKDGAGADDEDEREQLGDGEHVLHHRHQPDAHAVDQGQKDCKLNVIISSATNERPTPPPAFPY